jgi:hypothetical protein
MPVITYPHFIDFEASGFGDDSYPIEVAWNDAAGMVEAHLINPASIKGWTHWDPQAQINAHKIERTDLEKLGTDPLTVAKRMNDTLAGQVLYTDAPQFDGFWLSRLFEACDLRTTFKLGSAMDLLDLIIDDTQKLAGNSPQQVQDRFETIVDTLGLTAWSNIGLKPHRAGNDVRHLMEIYRLLNECSTIPLKC